MNFHYHLAIQERQLIFLYHGLHFTIRWIARLLKRYPTTTSRELRRCTLRRSIFLVATERLYYQCKHTCG
ncbi:helix-turn-helix domain-containing protein (plasmid) [Lactiplantibacillus plantarum subsp. plantarum]|uniref:helix-turn-helix domain-containing protein n=1 Tax=Lactiplantibacillus plantarum TaxID=1590 RepID=UPI00099F5DBC|nr:helix-turn-helix domain-containing protein [Lactiplantibacillus plantarum]AQX95123.1 hypothetical protein LC611_15510 [Lactiplantibacillus plantarum]AWL17546.1 hypothetical protein DHT46_15635 [Lactiplantibacillus plantarum]AYA81794.1 hypothetical protein DWG19_15565 [Lactiplantibacillus plantarum]AYC70486.1 hypothetical protein D5291_15800 [Lactiplantibacillus plantarum]AYC76326.1 hypothetical protein D5290_15640 [Lactiplantibacillus plantarum]